MAPGLFSDIYCASKLHIFKSLRNKWCKDWDDLHPKEAAISRGEVKDDAQNNESNNAKEDEQPNIKDAAVSDSPSAASPDSSRRSNSGGGRRSNGNNVVRGQAAANASRPTATSDTDSSNNASLPTPDANVPVAATSTPNPTPIGPNKSTFPNTLSPSATAEPISSIANPGLVAGVVVAACVAVLVVAGFLVHRHRRRQSLQKREFLHDDEAGVFRPDVVQVTRDAGLAIQDFSAAPPGLLDLPRGHASSLRDIPLNISPQPAPRVLPSFEKPRPSNRDSWPVQPRQSLGHRRTPTKDVIFVHSTGDDDAHDLHVNYHVPPVPSPPLNREASASNASSNSSHDVFGTPIYEDLTAAINAATAQALASPTAESPSRNVFVRSSLGSNHSSRSGVKLLVEERHSMEWPEDDLDDPIAMMRMEEELRAVRGESLRGLVEEFPAVPNVDPTDPRL